MMRSPHLSLKKFIAYFLIPALILLQSGLPFNAKVQAAALEGISENLEQAQKYYIKGQFEKTVEMIHLFLKNDAPDKNGKLKAYALLAKTFIAKNEPETAKEIIRKILDLEPDYQPTLEQEKPSYVNLVDTVRAEFKPNVAATQAEKSSFKINWLWVGSGATAAAVVGAVILSKNNNGKSDALPKPPPLPK